MLLDTDYLPNILYIEPGAVSTQKDYVEYLWAMHRFLQGRRREETKDLVLVLAEFISLMSPTGRLAIKNSSGKNIGAMVVSVAETRKSHEGRYRLSHWLADGTLSDSTTNS